MPETQPTSSRLSGWAKKSALLVISAMTATIVLEVAFRAAGHRPLYEVYSKPEAFWTSDPLLGWSLKPGSNGWYVGPRPFPITFRSRVRINSLGLRGAEIKPVAAGGKRVLMLGDSQTAGFEVAEGLTFAALTQKKLASLVPFPVQVVNAGIRGYGTDQSLLLYEKRLRKLQPDLVVFNPTSNDPEDNTTLHRPRRPFGKAAFSLKPNGATELVGHPIPRYPTCSAYRLDAAYRPGRVDSVAGRTACYLETRLSDRSALFSFATSKLRQNPAVVNRLFKFGGRAEAAAVSRKLNFEHRLTSVLIQKIASLAGGDGARFVLLADDSDLANLDLPTFQREGIEIVRPNEVLGADQRPFRIPNDGHLNKQGHRRVAQLLAPRVAALLTP